MNDDLISRKAALLAFIEKGQNSKRYKWGESWKINGEEIREVLDNLPSVQPKTGRWESAYNSTEEGYPYNYCSECGFETGARCFWNYCPNCGAKMEGEL